MIVAVDGPAGSGKSSVCAKVCDRIGWTYVNTGFLYRAIAYLAQKSNTSWDDKDQLLALVDYFASHYRWDPHTGQLFIDQEDVTHHLQEDRVGIGASRVGKLAYIRQALLPIQRQLGLIAKKGAIVDGRDIGTVVFPDANLKIFLTASLEQRAKRRQAQFAMNQSSCLGLEQIKEEMAKRDNQDQNRNIAPLKKADDAIVLDTSAMDVDTVVEEILGVLRERQLI